MGPDHSRGLHGRESDQDDSSQSVDTSTESGRAQQLIERAAGKPPEDETVAIQSKDMVVDQTQYRAYVEGLAGKIRSLEGTVAGVTTYYDAQEPSLVSANRKTTLINVVLAGEHGAAGRPQLVPAELAGMAAPREHRRSRSACPAHDA